MLKRLTMKALLTISIALFILGGFIARTTYVYICFLIHSDVSASEIFKSILGFRDSIEGIGTDFQFPLGDSVQQDPEWLKSRRDYMTNMYYSQWSSNERNHFPKDIPFDQITNVFYCFMGIDKKTGKIKYGDEYSDLEIESTVRVESLKLDANNNHSKTDNFVLKELETTGNIDQFMKIKKLSPNLSVLMSVGGWGYGDEFSQIVKNPKKLDEFVNSAIMMMQKHEFSGIDIDWEFPENAYEADQMVELLKRLRYEFNRIEMREGLAPGSLKLTVASPCASPHMETLKLVEMDKYLSFWNLMCYDFAGAWSDKVEYHSNLYSTHEGQISADSGVNYYLHQGIHPRKLVLGMPNYGRGFTGNKGYGDHFEGVGPGTADEAGIYNYKYLPLKGSEEGFDDEAVAAYSYDPKTQLWISYDNEQSAIMKADYVRKMNLGGGMWWESCGENYDYPNRSTVFNFVSEINRLIIMEGE